MNALCFENYLKSVKQEKALFNTPNQYRKFSWSGSCFVGSNCNGSFAGKIELIQSEMRLELIPPIV